MPARRHAYMYVYISFSIYIYIHTRTLYSCSLGLYLACGLAPFGKRPEGSKDHIHVRLLQAMVVGIRVALGLRTRTYAHVVSGASRSHGAFSVESWAAWVPSWALRSPGWPLPTWEDSGGLWTF